MEMVDGVVLCEICRQVPATGGHRSHMVCQECRDAFDEVTREMVLERVRRKRIAEASKPLDIAKPSH